jgi:hypothetical protein
MTKLTSLASLVRQTPPPWAPRNGVFRMGETNRRLAGILAADVVGYSAKVGADEPGTLARVRALRTDLIEPLAGAHGGRLFKTTGDGFLLEFASAVQALRCAIAIQDAVNASPTPCACASASTKAKSSPKATTCSETASSSRPGWNRWPNPAASAFRPACARTQPASSASMSKTWARRR